MYRGIFMTRWMKWLWENIQHTIRDIRYKFALSMGQVARSKNCPLSFYRKRNLYRKMWIIVASCMLYRANVWAANEKPELKSTDQDLHPERNWYNLWTSLTSLLFNYFDIFLAVSGAPFALTLRNYRQKKMNYWVFYFDCFIVSIYYSHHNLFYTILNVILILLENILTLK